MDIMLRWKNFPHKTDKKLYVNINLQSCRVFVPTILVQQEALGRRNIWNMVAIHSHPWLFGEHFIPLKHKFWNKNSSFVERGGKYIYAIFCSFKKFLSRSLMIGQRRAKTELGRRNKIYQLSWETHVKVSSGRSHFGNLVMLCNYFCVQRPWKQSISKEMKNDLNFALPRLNFGLTSPLKVNGIASMQILHNCTARGKS